MSELRALHLGVAIVSDFGNIDNKRRWFSLGTIRPSWIQGDTSSFFFFIQSNQGEYDMALVDSEGNQLYFGSYSLSQVIRLKKRYHLFEALFSSTLHPSLYLVQDSQLVCEQSGGKFSCA